MIIIGIDPGFDRLGWAVGQKQKGELRVLSFGAIQTNKTLPLFERYQQVDKDLTAILEEFHPDQAAIESLFFFKNQKTVIQVAESRGIILSALLHQSVTVFEYTPRQIKAAVTGYGNADKKGIDKMVRKQLKLPQEIKIIDDASDALAVLLTHSFAAVNLQQGRQNKIS